MSSTPTLNLNHLNSRQREAVLHPNGPLLILAGAGSGKTSTMAYRIAHLIAVRNIAPTDVLGLSFTNKAAFELKDRVSKLVSKAAGPRATRGLVISTFHSLCVRLLRIHAERLGFQNDFSIVDRADQKDILRTIFKNLNVDDRKFDHDVILSEIGQAKSRFLEGDIAQSFFLESGRLPAAYQIATAEAFQKYQGQLKILNSMDFDDLLYYGVKLLETCDDVRAHYNARFRYILVDEYQDTNPSQFKLLELLTQRQNNICVVGDDDQSIYSWRGADPTHILGFDQHYPGARTITLDQNYRSTSRILEAANKVISNNSKRHPKQLWSDRGEGEPITEVVLEEDREEAEWVSDEILRRTEGENFVPGSVALQGGNQQWKNFAVLYRSNPQSRIFEEAFRRKKIPYKIVGGMSFLDRKEIKNVLCLWRLVVNHHDDASLRRILNWPARGIGRGAFESLNDHAFKSSLPLFSSLTCVKEVAPRAAVPVEQFRDSILALRHSLEATEMDNIALVQWARFSLEKMGVKKAIEEESDDPVQFAKKWENVEELLHSLGQIKLQGGETEFASPVAVVQEYLSRMALQAQEEEEDKDDKDTSNANQVTLLTLHGAKGLEYPVVFLVGMEDGYLPHQRSIEEAVDLSEERRLCYVGITRARDHLILTRAKNRIRYGKPVPRYRSRFLDEIPAELILLTDKSFPTDQSPREVRDAHEERVKNFASSIREMLARGQK
jgi:DNA helicase-2/ATP-dependent DNA helicase PcrA